MPVSDQPARPPESASRPRKALTIGAVCKIVMMPLEVLTAVTPR